MKLFFTFYDFNISIVIHEAKHSDCLKWIFEDFGYFAVSENQCAPLHCSINIVDSFKVSKLTPFVSSKYCKIYGWHKNRLFKYNEATELLDVKNVYHRQAFIKSTETQNIYEITRNYILSLLNEHMENSGWMGFHALGIQSSDNNTAFVLPSRGGKSSLATEYLFKTNGKIFSDTAVFTNGENIRTLPMCLSLTERSAKYLGISLDGRRSFKKMYLDEKFLSPVPLDRVALPGALNKLYVVNSNLIAFVWGTFWGKSFSQTAELFLRLNNIQSLIKRSSTRAKILSKLFLDKKVEFIKLKKPLRLNNIQKFFKIE